MAPSLLRLVSLTLALVLSGTPAMAAACAGLCAPAGVADHGVHAATHAAQHAAEPVRAVPAGQHHHHDAPETPAAPDTRDTSNTPDAPNTVADRATHTRPAAVVASIRDCCADLAGVSLAPARAQTRADVAPPLVATSAIDTDAGAMRTSPAHDPPVSPPPPPAPVRSPLILRI